MYRAMTGGGGVTEIIDPLGNYFPSGDPAPSGAWVVAEDWSRAQGELTNIWNAFVAQGGNPRDAILWWSPDGTVLTLGSSSADNTLVFSCSTPWDPDTASQIFNLFVTNESWGHYNTAGTRYVGISSTDTYRMRAASGHGISNATVLSDVSKTEVGFTSSTDAPAIWGPDLDYALWMGGDGGGDAIKDVSFPSADLDSWVVESTYNHGSINPSGQSVSNLDATETMCYEGAGSAGCYIISFDSPREITSFARSSVYDLRTNVPASFDFRPGSIWFDPNNTRYLWMVADPTNNLQIVKYDTGAGT